MLLFQYELLEVGLDVPEPVFNLHPAFVAGVDLGPEIRFEIRYIQRRCLGRHKGSRGVPPWYGKVYPDATPLSSHQVSSETR